MTDTKTLREIVRKKGIKYMFIAEQLGITPYCLQKKIDNFNDFKGREIVEISKILNLSPKQRDSIFFGNDVD